uniref:Jasmintide 8 n=1 Tax=Jasminum sambac TaxID=660624 RepID=A0A2K9QL90_9LAMI|nr:jasmintide 8 precursor [Jasminum sambac]
MEKASVKLTFLTLFLITIAVAVAPVPKVEARELQPTLRMPVANMEAKELPQLTLHMQLPNQLCLLCTTNADCNAIWRWCRDGCCHLF